jgi:nucleoside-diphosphate-sugar epimerase
MKICVTGGAGYIGSLAVTELLEQGHAVSVLDSLLHGQAEVADGLRARGATVVVGDVRDEASRREALAGCETVVHLAAIVGDPACARDETLSNAVNLGGSRALVADAAALGVRRFLFASTCSNYGRTDPDALVDESAALRPVSLYAEQKVAIEQELLAGESGIPEVTCLRFATIYGVGQRMRFDLTVNQFVRNLWSGETLEVYGEQFWRPYVHVRDAARAIALTVGAPAELVAGQVFNVGDSDENYTKKDLVRLIVEHLGHGEATYVARDEDPRDYRVSFERIRRRMGFEPAMRVPDGIVEVTTALERRQFGDPYSPAFVN